MRSTYEVANLTLSRSVLTFNVELSDNSFGTFFLRAEQN